MIESVLLRGQCMSGNGKKYGNMLKQSHKAGAGWTTLTALKHDIRDKSLND